MSLPFTEEAHRATEGSSVFSSHGVSYGRPGGTGEKAEYLQRHSLVFKSLIHSFLTVGSWTIFLFLLDLDFFICKIGRQYNTDLMGPLSAKCVMSWWLD